MKGDDVAGAPEPCDDGGLGLASRLENISRALILFDIPEETLVFFVTKTGVESAFGGSAGSAAEDER